MCRKIKHNEREKKKNSEHYYLFFSFSLTHPITITFAKPVKVVFSSVDINTHMLTLFIAALVIFFLLLHSYLGFIQISRITNPISI
jgi:hypothetical protein